MKKKKIGSRSGYFFPLWKNIVSSYFPTTPYLLCHSRPPAWPCEPDWSMRRKFNSGTAAQELNPHTSPACFKLSLSKVQGYVDLVDNFVSGNDPSKQRWTTTEQYWMSLPAVNNVWHCLLLWLSVLRRHRVVSAKQSKANIKSQPASFNTSSSCTTPLHCILNFNSFGLKWVTMTNPELRRQVINIYKGLYSIFI